MALHSILPRSDGAAAIAHRLCLKAGSDADLAEIVAEVVGSSLDAAHRAAVQTRRTSGRDEDCSDLLCALGFAKLVSAMTPREQAVLLAVLPQLHRILHYGPSLARTLVRWLGVPVHYVGHVPRRHTMHRQDRSRLSKAHSRLGIDFVLGADLVENRSTIAFTTDLRAKGAVKRVLDGGWAEFADEQLSPATKLKLLTEHLFPASLHVEWRWLTPVDEPGAYWRLGCPAQSRLGISTRILED